MAADGSTAVPVESDIVTLQVPPEAAQEIISGDQLGLRLTLVRPDYQPRPIESGFSATRSHSPVNSDTRPTKASLQAPRAQAEELADVNGP